MPVVFTNGTIRTVDASAPRPDWVEVADGRITDVGSGPVPAGEVYDLAGRTLMPAFQDAHVHPTHGGLAMIRCDLHPLATPDEYLAEIARYASANPDLRWIVGGGWSMDSVPNGIARAEWIDRIVPDRPVYLHSSEGHAAWVNSRALALAGITRETPDPPDGRIERDADGTANGTLQEGAEWLVTRVAPPDTAEDLVAGLLAGQRHLVDLGIGTWQDAWVEPGVHEAYRTVDAAGDLRASVVGALWWDRARGIEQLDELLERGREGTARYRPITIKLMVDGVCENGTAAMQAPYEGTDDDGISFIPRDMLLEAVPLIMAAGVQPHFHAIGDRAIRDALDAVAAGDPADAARTRPHIAHIQVIHDDDVARFAALGVTANTQSYWACNDSCMTDLTIPRLGAHRVDRLYRFRDLADAGARLAFGSDWAVSTADVFEQMAVAVSRRLAPNDDPFRPAQSLSAEQVLDGFTMGSAFVNHRDDISGSITPGKVADLVVASADPLLETDIAGITVDATFLDGELVGGAEAT